ncbi:MAG: carbohydrate kinase [Sphingobacteriia bacterium]|jgi:rfaE bifunctional protein kinase chain/domain|nr:MAG: carbohydrate kinase [Sphingobacteriia bacterium]TAG31831.1 MAG: carbohydrate kinase [Sphingobacteriia bacterium]TAH07840.1 MAG: carbohydrate kinase [Sphingobacteriia bacterium]
MNFDQLFNSFSSTNILILGDIMLDTYWWGTVDRISPEAPVPVVALVKKEYRVGGAANVALNTASLGARTGIISVIGDDADGDQLLELMKAFGIDTTGILRASNRITTNKVRVMGRNQQMMRLDGEVTHDIDLVQELALIESVEKYIELYSPAVLIFEDYNKGVLTKSIIAAVTEICNKKGIITSVDPKRKNFLSYKGVTLFKPNLKEVKDGLNLLVEELNQQSLSDIHESLRKELQHSISLITLSEKGVFYQSQNDSFIIPTHIRNIADVSGAGDTVIAVASLVYAATRNIQLAAEMANIAGGLVCEEVGTVAIDKQKLLEECNLLLSEI